MTPLPDDADPAPDLPPDPSLKALARVGFVGAGAVASALARALDAKGASVIAVSSHAPAQAVALAKLLPGCLSVTSPAEVAARVDTVFLAVPDDAIVAVADGIAWRPGHRVAHLSGSRGLAPLASAAARGARVAALHPLMTFPMGIRDWPLPRLMARFAGCMWALEADDTTLAAVLEGMVGVLGGRVMALSAEQRLPYHLSAVLASNYVVALLGAAVQLWQGFGLAPEEALAALAPLTRAAIERVEALGLPAALTGPVARGDTGTVASHLEWLREQAPTDSTLAPLAEAYVALARLAMPLALAKGTLAPEAAAMLDALLSQYSAPSDISSSER